MTYPHTPGWRKSSIGETARDAAKRMETRAPNLRQQVLAIIAADGPQTPEQVFATLVARGVKTVLTSVRPRRRRPASDHVATQKSAGGG